MNLNSTNISILKRLLVGRNSRPLRRILDKVPPVDLAAIFVELNEREIRALINALISMDKAAQTLMMLPESQLPEMLAMLTDAQLVDVLRDAPDDQASQILLACQESRRNALIGHFDGSQQHRLHQLLNYPEDSAGRIMHTEVFSVSLSLTAAQALEILRSRAAKESIYYIYVVDEEHRLKGVVSLRALAIASHDTPLSDLIQQNVLTVQPESPAEDAAHLVSHYDFIALPVVDGHGKLLGIVTVDDVLDIIEDKATADIYAQAGLQEDDRVYSTAKFSIKNRLPWMCLNLVMATMASGVVSLFEETMGQLIILASLNNIVAGIGGNTAIQTLTVVTRGLATGDFDFTKYSKAILKETAVGAFVGLTMGLLAGLLVWLWKGSLLVGCVISVAMFLNSLVAAAFGALIPIVLKRLGRDPAIGSGVLVTTVTDMFGFFCFLGIASLALSFFT